MSSRRLALALAFLLPAAAEAETTVVRAGRLVDPEKGTVLTNQTIVVDGEKITAVGSDPPVPAGARVIDLSALTLPPASWTRTPTSASPTRTSPSTTSTTSRT